MPDEHPVLRMRLDEVQRFVADLEEKYRTWASFPEPPTATTPCHLLTLADLATIRASLQRSVAHLDELLREQR